MAISSAAFAEGPYLSLGGGLHLPNDSSVLYTRPVGIAPAVTTSTPADITFDMGYIVSGALGYKWDSGLRSELELNYREATVNDIAGAGSPGAQNVLGVMANLLYDFGDETASFRPYIGAGVGAGWNKWKNVQGAPSATLPIGTSTFTDRDTAWQWQLIAGVTKPFSEKLDGFVEYRYIGLQANKFSGVSIPLPSAMSRHNDRSHNLLVGLRWNFGTKAAPMQTATAVAPPAPPPVPQKFLVFFDFDRANLRADAQKIVSEAADYAKKNGKVVIRATGHADTSSTPAYNLGLSERRANAVKAALAKLGFKPNEVIVSFKGESEPLVATGDGVKEPQNRRVEIVME